ncbi:MAG: ABC transporter ATP-binding protein [Coprobacillus sp.]|nr:ABC transporter ATP-binding protein [Coprobacillus sp.]
MSEEIILEARHLCKEYQSGPNVVKAINDFNLSVRRGELLVVLGPSGAGKTTLLNLIGGMDVPTSGELYVSGEDIAKYNSKQLTDFRRNSVGFVFQFYNLMPNLTAKENVELASELKKDSYTPEEVLTKVGLGDRLDNFPAQLSGGEQQRVSIARAVCKNPDIILCDEPTGALDYSTGKMILALLQDFSRHEDKTVIIVTHNSALADMGDRVVHIKNGQIESIDTNENPKPIEEISW